MSDREADRTEEGAPPAPAGKRVQRQVTVAAPPDVVWEAISDAEQLRRWLPLDASVEPGVGGKVTLSWGPGMEGTSTIEVWDVGERLLLAEELPGESGPVRVALDLRIEGAEGGTVLRLVHSGFSPDDDWADFVETLDSGWQYFLLNLKHYLERHRGEPRRMVWDRRRIDVPKADAWQRLLGEDGLVSGFGDARVGATGRLWSGQDATVILENRPIHLALRVPGLYDALLFLELEPGGDTYSLGTWLSLYGDAGDGAPELERSLDETLGRLFEPVEEPPAGPAEAPS